MPAITALAIKISSVLTCYILSYILYKIQLNKNYKIIASISNSDKIISVSYKTLYVPIILASFLVGIELESLLISPVIIEGAKGMITKQEYMLSKYGIIYCVLLLTSVLILCQFINCLISTAILTNKRIIIRSLSILWKSSSNDGYMSIPIDSVLEVKYSKVLTCDLLVVVDNTGQEYQVPYVANASAIVEYL